jgi:hypothetical protein
MFRRIVSGVTFGVATCGLLGLVGGCLTRPVEASDPITKTNFITSIATGTIDKVDILFDIDNSASMGDKQAYLSKAIPDLLTRLVQPNCVDTNMNITGQSSLAGTCTDPNSNPEFPPVHNMHIGVVSSSLGQRLGNQCQANAMQNTPQGAILRHNDDLAHLLNRTADPNQLTNYTEGTLADAPSIDNFLDWFPPATTNPSNAGITFTGPTPVSIGPGDSSVLNSDFQQLVTGVHQFGCGIESQLETWYRFLVQPDPYGSLKTVACGKNQCAAWDGVDTTILQQRADFLRPDSLVAIIVLTDENDSEVDVRSFGGTAWNFMTSTPAFNPPRGTQICQTSPGDPGCTSCAFGKNGSDPNCMTNNGVYSDPHDWGADLNLRHVHEKAKYGVSVQFPIQRYVLGLTSTRVPNRDGEYPPGASSYQGLVNGNIKCINPLYAAKLPNSGGQSNWNPSSDELCNLTPGNRKPGLVFYAHIGGVPHQLLQVNPMDPNSDQKATLSEDDWTLILGKDPENFDYTGIDPHMVEDYKPRTAVPVPTNGFPLAGPTSPEGTDPISGREWVTNSAAPNGEHQGLLVDREYSCTFKLETPRDCSDSATMADQTLQDSCDCQPPNPNTGTLSPAEIPAVCNSQTPTQQDYAKAYPTIRELELAHFLGQVNGANEGIISSLCPIHTTDQSADGKSDQLYGYRPAMNAIINKLKNALSNQCLPQRLTIDPQTNQVPCLILGTFSGPAGSMGVASSCEAVPGGAYITPDPTVIKEFKADQHGQWVQAGSNGDDPSTDLTCEVAQLPPNKVCNNSSADNGWCYIDNITTSTGCAQEILFSKTALQPGVVTSLQCLESSSGLDGGIVTSAPASGSISGGTTTSSDAGGASD